MLLKYGKFNDNWHDNSRTLFDINRTFMFHVEQGC